MSNSDSWQLCAHQSFNANDLCCDCGVSLERAFAYAQFELQREKNDNHHLRDIYASLRGRLRAVLGGELPETCADQDIIDAVVALRLRPPDQEWRMGLSRDPGCECVLSEGTKRRHWHSAADGAVFWEAGGRP